MGNTSSTTKTPNGSGSAELRGRCVSSAQPGRPSLYPDLFSSSVPRPSAPPLTPPGTRATVGTSAFQGPQLTRSALVSRRPPSSPPPRSPPTPPVTRRTLQTVAPAVADGATGNNAHALKTKPAGSLSAAFWRFGQIHVCGKHGSKSGCAGQCRKFHICHMFLADICNFGDGCQHGHSLDTPHNREVARLLGRTGGAGHLLSELRGDVTRLGLLSTETYHRRLTLCFRYMGPQGCRTGDCNRLHICRKLVESVCRFGSRCKFAHSLGTPHNAAVLRKHKAAELTDAQVFDLLRARNSGSENKPSGAVGHSGSAGGQTNGRNHNPAPRSKNRPKSAGKSSADERWDADVGQIAEELICAVCMELFEDPYTIACGHSFCRGCLDDLDRSSAYNCPLCRQVIGGASRSVALSSVVNNIRKQSQGQ